jgi:hypothetical protein
MPRNGYRAVSIDRFGGLDVRRDPQEDQGGVRAIDMLNVDLDADGRIKSRSGSTKLTSKSATTTYNSLAAFPRPSTTNPQVLTVTPSTAVVSAFDAVTGSAIASHTPTGPSFPARIEAYTMIGVPTASAVMYMTVSGGDYLIKYDGSAFTGVVAVSGGAQHMAVQLPDNRLVLGNSGVATTKSRVVFSAPNDPETFNLTDDYVDLFPGDGEQIVGMANFGNYLFVFKQSTFFRFYGNQTDPTGGTIFAYDFQKHNLATPAYSQKVCAAGREGVYFLAKDGVYLTSGGPPKKISAPLDPLFKGSGIDQPGYFTGTTSGLGAGTFSQIGIYYVGGRLYMPTGNGSTLFVYDPSLDAWMFWEMLNSQGMTNYGIAPILAPGAVNEVPYFLHVNAGPTTFASVISYLDPAALNDQGHTLSVTPQTVYRTNFMDLGEPSSMKTIRELLFDGSMSACQVDLSVDNALAPAGTASGSVTTDPTGSPSQSWPSYAIGQGRLREAARGSNFSLKVTGSAWVIDRAVLHQRNQRPAGPRNQT